MEAATLGDGGCNPRRWGPQPYVALFSQVIVVEAPKKEGKGGKGGGGGGGLKFTMREEGVAEPVAVSIHPSSVNAKATRFESRYLVYAEMVKTTQVIRSRG